MDFSENFTLHDQSAYWDHEQLTLFTTSVSSKGMQTSITFVSDDLDHDGFYESLIYTCERTIQR